MLAEIALLGDHGRPGIEAGAVTLARLLDNPLAYTSHASAARVLSRLLDELHKSQRAPWGRLAAVQTMSRRGGSDAG